MISDYMKTLQSSQRGVVTVAAKFLRYYFPVRREVVCHFGHCPSVKTSDPLPARQQYEEMHDFPSLNPNVSIQYDLHGYDFVLCPS